MKIYSKIVISLKTDQVLYDEWEEYSGPIAYCGGGSKGGGDSVDKAYNAGMLALSQEQQEWAEQMFNMFKYGVTYDPYEKTEDGSTVGAQRGYDFNTTSEMNLMQQYFGAQSELMPYESETEKARLGYETEMYGAQKGLIPAQTEAAKAGLGLETSTAQMKQRLLPSEEAAQMATLGYTTAEAQSRLRLLPEEERTTAMGLRTAQMGYGERQQIITERSPVITALYKDALSGVDINRRVSEARAGVEHSFAGAETNLARTTARYGMAPSAADFRNLEIQKATGMAGAEAGVRTEAEQENFQRRVTALGMLG